ncbi:hypothetical protein [Mycobacterium paraterrae]|uniref:Uncharacterized protein n=1 Tax=Mycobacterium paraterrae TaxID=577492 RepID=A0ABY3VUP1_9MYCO|nr:hypothetical protein [Mycobacterium paraterrae]UMB70893.1 hypothetical protein MKK62_06290 [Mycobacterium paraterrae]
MKSTDSLQERTRMFARVLGPYLAIVAFSAALRPRDMKAMLAGYEANPLWSWVTGAFILVLGLTVIALHPFWRGVAAVLVSGLGWLVAVKGLVLVTASQWYYSLANSMIDSTGWWRTGAAVEVLIGLYLSYVGWVPAQGASALHEAKHATDLPRAA